MNWFWMNIPFATVIFLAMTMIPLWIVIKHPDVRKGTPGPARPASARPVSARPVSARPRTARGAAVPVAVRVPSAGAAAAHPEAVRADHAGRRFGLADSPQR